MNEKGFFCNWADAYSGGFRGGEPALSLPLFGRRTDDVTHGTPDMCQWYCIMATQSPIYLFKHVKYGTQNIKTIASSGFLTALECTKFVFGRKSAPNPAGGACSAPQPRSWFKQAYF